MKNNKKVVYIHRKKTDDTIFYVGIGNPNRAYDKALAQRSVVWHSTVKKHGYYVEIIIKDLSWEDACEIEIYLIKQFGRRDLKKGSLVNLTDGGEGGVGHISNLGKSVYNIETGEVFETMTKGSNSIGLSGSAVREQLGTYDSQIIKDNNPLRLMSDPYPEHTVFWDEVRKYEVSIDSDDFDEKCHGNYLGYENVEFDDGETEILQRIYEQPDESIDLIDMLYTKSVRGVSEELGLNRMKVFRMFDKCKENILKDRIGEYKNSRVKHLLKSN